jgi:ketosteroid isomerase-like protein
METTQHSPDVIAMVADRFARCAAERDAEGLRGVYAADARIWHNLDDAEKSVDESLLFLANLLAVTSRCWYEDVRITATGRGYLDQHYMCAALSTGEEVRVPVCAVVTLEGESVKRVEEYVEALAMGPVLEALAGGR